LLFRSGLIDKPHTLQEIRLHIAESERRWAALELQTVGLGGRRFLVGICPGASFGAAKRWLPERYANLADRLIDALGADVLIFGSRAEKPLAEAVARAMDHTPILVAGKTSLREFMALLAKCHLVITNDSGPMHLAAALGLPLLAIFGSTNERATGPVGLRVRIIKHPVECSPCGLRQCPIDFRCMTGISVDDVYTAALESVRNWETAP
jgi:heptosyltransferase-2